MKRVVIIGGGFTGSYTARILEKTFDVTLIDTKDYFEFTPGILPTIVDPSCVKDVQVMHTHYLKKAKVVIGTVTKFTKEAVFLDKIKIPFDYLIISSGSKYNAPFKGGDAICADRVDMLRGHARALRSAQRVLVIGGGASGVELTAEIACAHPEKKITLVHAMGRLLEKESEKVSRYAEKQLKKNGVKIIFNELITKGSKGDVFSTNKGRTVKADIAFLCVGITPNSEFIRNSFPKLVDRKGYVAVTDSLQLHGLKNIFVGGDVTGIKEAKTAQNALEHAKVIVNNVKRLEKKQSLLKYQPEKRATIISIGKWKGILCYRGFVLTGFLPRLLKTFVEIKEMWGMKEVVL